MANPTTNFGWVMPTSTDLVTDLPADFAIFGQAVDTSMADLKGGTTGQVLSKATNADMDFTWVAQDDSNAIQNAIVDAKGDLITATAADTPARLAVGTNGQTLVADSSTATGLKWATPTSSSGPAFSAYKSADQTTTATTFEKITFNTETFDTDNNFASSTFTPTKAGYYSLNFLALNTSGTYQSAYWYVNGSSVRRVSNYNTGNTNTLNDTYLVYLNGTTDYVEIYFYGASNGTVFGGSSFTVFSGVWIRS